MRITDKILAANAEVIKKLSSRERAKLEASSKFRRLEFKKLAELIKEVNSKNDLVKLDRFYGT